MPRACGGAHVQVRELLEQHGRVMPAERAGAADAGGGGNAAYQREVLDLWNARGRVVLTPPARFRFGDRVAVEAPDGNAPELPLAADPWLPGAVEAVDAVNGDFDERPYRVRLDDGRVAGWVAIVFNITSTCLRRPSPGLKLSQSRDLVQSMGL